MGGERFHSFGQLSRGNVFLTTHNACIVFLQRLSTPFIIAGSMRGCVIGICLNWVKEAALGHGLAKLVLSSAGASFWRTPSRGWLQKAVSGALVRHDYMMALDPYLRELMFQRAGFFRHCWESVAHTKGSSVL